MPCWLPLPRSYVPLKSLENSMKGCGIFLGSMIVGLGIGMAVAGIVWTITRDDKIASAIGTGFWLTSAFAIHAYASVWAVSLGAIGAGATGPSGERFRSKLRTAEIRYAFVFGALDGEISHSVGVPWYLVVTIGGLLIMLGG